jgi:transposase
MDSAVVDMLNSLRTQAFSKDGRAKVLDVVDAVERYLQRQDDQLTTYHRDLAQRERRIAEILAEKALIERKFALSEEHLRLELARRFGKSRERWTPDEKLQAELFNEIEVAIREAERVAKSVEIENRTGTDAEVMPEIGHARRRGKEIVGEETGHGGRSPLPAHLLRVEKIIGSDESNASCGICDTPWKKIGEERSERLCMEPIKFFVEVTVRPIYVSGCTCSGGKIATAPKPNHIIPKSIASPSLLAQIMASKFCDALPFYRQANILKSRERIEISRATMARWAQDGYELLKPMVELLRQRIRGSPVMNMDETRVRVLHEDGKAKESHSWMWCAAAKMDLAKPEGNRRDLKLISFHYAGSRSREVAEELLAGFKGTLMSDAYAAYNDPSTKAGIIQAACMAHVRRKFHDVLKVEPHNPYAEKALAFIRALYEVEKEFGEGPPDDLLKARQEKSSPLMDAFWKWLIEQEREVIPKSTLGKAVSYTIPLWDRLEVFLHDPRVPIDNNLAENAIRPFAVGRRNWLFFDQDRGAEASSAYYTLSATAIANDMEPMHYFRFLFACIEYFGADEVPWEKLFPIPSLRDYADFIGIPYNLG